MQQIKYVGIDSFNRPVFKSLDGGRGKFYGDTQHLFSYGATESEVLDQINENDLCYFGSKFGCEPYGTAAGNIKIIKKDQVIS